MSTGNSIQRIIANGGGCQIHPKRGQSLIDQSLGRIIYEGSDYLLLQRFNLGIEFLDGYFLVPKGNLKLRKAYWVKQDLTVGGQVLEDAQLPKELVQENWTAVLHTLKNSAEAVKLNLDSDHIYGCIEALTPEEIILKRIEQEHIHTLTTIRRNALQIIELRAKSIKELSKGYKHFLTREKH